MALGGLPVSVVVISKNSGQTIGECLESVARNRPSEVIVVDGGSTDSTLEIAARYRERIIHDGIREKACTSASVLSCLWRTVLPPSARPA